MPNYSVAFLKMYAQRLIKYGVHLLELCEDMEYDWTDNNEYNLYYTKIKREEKQCHSRAKYRLRESKEERLLWEDLLKSITQVTEKPVE